jgi:ArsR family transcriptional regulator, virulence genes transcriptional regulator
MATAALADFAARANDAASLLRALGNKKRLMILCELMEHGEVSVLPLAKAVDLGQSALSQHLARLREERIVDCRREGQSVYYRICDSNTKRLIKSLKSIFCCVQ